MSKPLYVTAGAAIAVWMVCAGLVLAQAPEEPGALERTELTQLATIQAIAFSPDGKVLAAAGCCAICLPKSMCTESPSGTCGPESKSVRFRGIKNPSRHSASRRMERALPRLRKARCISGTRPPANWSRHLRRDRPPWLAIGYVSDGSKAGECFGQPGRAESRDLVGHSNGPDSPTRRRSGGHAPADVH